MSLITHLCVFCGSSIGDPPEYREAAHQVADLLVERRITLVYGGGNIGLMGAVADRVMDQGGQVIGVIPRSLVDWEVAHYGLTRLEVVPSMHERKARMADLADAFLALPGGFGTFEEFCEVLTWAQLGFHQKPCGLLNLNGFYDPLLALFDRATHDRLLRREHRNLVLTGESPVQVFEQMLNYHAPHFQKWIDRDET